MNRRFFLSSATAVLLVVAAPLPVLAAPVTVAGFTTADIHQAILAAGPHGTVIFPNGVYDCDGVTASQPNQSWLFESEAAILLRNPTSGASLITRSVPGWLWISRGTFDGNRSNNPVPAFAIVGMVDGCHLELRDTIVQNISFWAIGADNAELWMFDCTVRNTKLACVIQRASRPIRAPQLYRCVFDRSMEPEATVDSACVLVGSLSTGTNMMISPRLVDCEFRLPACFNEFAPNMANVVGVELAGCQRGFVEGCSFSGGRINLSIANSSAMVIRKNAFNIWSSYAIEIGTQDWAVVAENYGTGGGGNPWSRHGISVNPATSGRLSVYVNRFTGWWQANVFDPSGRITSSWDN